MQAGIKRIDTKVQIIMVSTLNFTNVKAGIEGLERGAAEFLQTPAAHTKVRATPSSGTP